MVKYAFDYSEKYHTPVLMRMVTRMAHSRAVVESGEPIAQNKMSFPATPGDWVLMPAVAKRRNAEVIDLQEHFLSNAEASLFNRLTLGKDNSIGIIACGIAYNYLMELYPDGCPYSVLKVSQYPLPIKLILELAANSRSLLVLEDGQPFVEEMVKGVLPTPIPVRGRLSNDVPRTGELTPDNIRPALGLQDNPTFATCPLVVPRPPALCQGCGHRDMYTALNEVLSEYSDARVFSDIGCYTLGFLPPYRAIHSVVDMGASITMAKGASDAGQHPSVAVIGDSTFTHSGMTGLLDAVNENSNITILISDNLTTGMTGGQDSAGTGRLESICKGIGVPPEHVKVVIPLPKNMEEMKKIIRDEINHNGVSVIIPRRECIQTARRHSKKQ